MRGVGTATVTLVVAAAMLLPIGAVLQIVLAGQMDDRTPTQAIVVLDPAHYWGDPGPVLEARVAHAAALYRAGVAPGRRAHRAGTLGRAGPRALVADGVPARDVVHVHDGRRHRRLP